uniref:Uncharacterized protein n=1 Tax=Panagrolaimus sp. JU765 TaxID=591449 RepID=A0AC34R6Q4_9BILA
MSKSFETLLPPDRYLNSSTRLDINIGQRALLSNPGYEVVFNLQTLTEDGTTKESKFRMDATQLRELSKQVDEAISTFPKCKRYR